jgi:hypothetical protein
MATRNGLIPPLVTHSAPSNSYYALKTGGVLTDPTLVSPVELESADGNGSAQLTVVGFEGNPPVSSVYTGSIGLRPGTSSLGAAPAGVNIRSIANGVAVEIGTDGAGIVNTLGVAGADGVAQVYDELYNQPVDLRPITLSATDPLCAPDPNNVGEIFRCEQAGVAAAASAAIGTNFVVPKTGWYALQTEVKLGNAPVPAAPTINVPITVAPGGVNFGETLSFSFADGVVTEPYGLMEVTSNEFVVSDILVANTITVRTYTSLHLFEAGNTYTFSLRASSGVWNIGDVGQIKCELIAMC